MRIPVIEVITHLALGGAQRVAITLAEKLDRDKFDLHLVSSEEGGFLQHAKNIDNCTFHPARHLLRELSLKHDSKVVFELASIFRKIKKASGANMAIVHTHAPKAGVAGRYAARLSGCTPIHTLHGLPFNPLQSTKKQFAYKTFESLGYLAGGQVASVTQFGLEWLLQSGLVKKENTRLIRPCVDMDNLHPKTGPREILTKWAVSDDDTVIGYVASLKPPKDPFTFLKACKKVVETIDNVKVVIVGDGFLKNEIALQVDKLGLVNNVVLTGWQSPIEPFYSEFDLLVLSTDSEGLPLTLIESRASGTPAIATDVGGISELIEDGESGLLVKPKDVDGLADAMLKIIEDKEFSKKLERQGLENLTDYHPETMVKAYEEMFLEIIGK